MLRLFQDRMENIDVGAERENNNKTKQSGEY